MDANLNDDYDPRNAIRWMARQRIIDHLTTAIADQNGWDHPDDVEGGREQAEQVLDLLTEDVVIFTSERWDESCHRCEQRIGDHTVDGRCPTHSEENRG